MKILSNLLVFIIFLFCFMWQNTYSQFLYPIEEKEEYLPPYVPNAVMLSPAVEKWINEQLANKDGNKRTVKMKTDVLGRIKSKFSSNEIGQEKIVENGQKRLVRISDTHIREHEIEPEHGRYEYNYEAKKYDYFLNGKKMNKEEYFEHIDKNFEKFKQQKKGKRDLPIPSVLGDADDRTWVALMTAEEISELVRKYKELSIHDYVETKEEASQAFVLSTLQLSTHAFPNGYGGNGIGVYVMEPRCALLSGITNLSKYTEGNSCGTTYNPNTHHTMVANIVQMASPSAHVFGFNWDRPGRYVINPSNPFLYSPPLEIGSHSYTTDTIALNEFYDDYDRDMDNYIYENRVINFTSAGNNQGRTVSSPGKAMNIITVGAVMPANNNYMYYLNHMGAHWMSSSWKNPILRPANGGSDKAGNDKPEIATYTDIEFNFPNNSTMQNYVSKFPAGFGGTSAATALAAGFTATLLSQHPFFKRKPALMKAVLLTGETIPIQNFNSWDRDNFSTSPYTPSVAKEIATYSGVAGGTRSAWWSGGNSGHFDSNKEIRFTENNIQANKRYRIAIAWLVEGSYVYNEGKLPQDIDLYVEQNGRGIASSLSARNPFELVDFVTTSNAPLTIRIYRYSNSGNGDVLLGYHMRENF